MHFGDDEPAVLDLHAPNHSISDARNVRMYIKMGIHILGWDGHEDGVGCLAFWWVSQATAPTNVLFNFMTVLCEPQLGNPMLPDTVQQFVLYYHAS